MATKKTVAVKTDTTNDGVEAKTEKVFALDVLQKHCRALFGVPTVVFAGATAQLDADKKYSVSKIKEVITTWCGKEVK